MPNKWLFFASCQLISAAMVATLLASCVSCDCGRPHRPHFGSYNPKQNHRFKEDSIVTYYCNQSHRLVYNEKRVCKYGVWSGRPVVCAKPLTSDVWLRKIAIYWDQISVFNTTDSYGDNQNIWKAEDNQKCVTSGARNQQNWTFVLSEPQKIDYLVIKLKNKLASDEFGLRQNINALLINNRIADLKTRLRSCDLLRVNTNDELEFTCRSFRKLTTTVEDKDKSDQIFINFNSDIFDNISVCALGVYQFPANCGRIGLPLELTVERVIDGRELEASCSDGFQMVGDSRIFCSSDGRWTAIPSCKPMTTCPLIEPINKVDPKVVRIEYKNAFYFNRTLLAISQTDAVHYCLKVNVTNNRNKSFSRNVVKYIRQCENGLWDDVDTDCDTLLIDSPSIERQFTDSTRYSIIIAIAFMIFTVSVIFFIWYIVIKCRDQNRETQSPRNSLNQLVPESDHKSIAFRNKENRLSDPFDNSIYSMIAEDSYDIFNFDGSRLNSGEQYDDTQVSRPYYLEIIPLNELSSLSSSVRSSRLS